MVCIAKKEILLEYLADFILFLAKTVTIIGGIAVIAALVAAVGQKTKKMHKGHLEVTRLNEHYEHLQNDLSQTAVRFISPSFITGSLALFVTRSWVTGFTYSDSQITTNPLNNPGASIQVFVWLALYMRVTDS